MNLEKFYREEPEAALKITKICIMKSFDVSEEESEVLLADMITQYEAGCIDGREFG